MCKRCVEIMRDYPADRLKMFAEHREEIEALAAKIGNKLGNEICNIQLNPTLTDEEKAIQETAALNHMNMAGLLAMVAYVAAKQNHDGHLIAGFNTVFEEGLQTGYFEHGAEIHRAKYN